MLKRKKRKRVLNSLVSEKAREYLICIREGDSVPPCSQERRRKG